MFFSGKMIPNHFGDVYEEDRKVVATAGRWNKVKWPRTVDLALSHATFRSSSLSG
jgi:hypothetical protein